MTSMPTSADRAGAGDGRLRSRDVAAGRGCGRGVGQAWAAVLVVLVAVVAASAADAASVGADCPALPLPPPATAEQLREVLGAGRTLSSGSVRRLYHCIIGHGMEALALPEAGGDEGSVCELSRARHAVRSAARKYTRERGSALSEALLRVRDYWKYGSGDGPSFDDLLARHAAASPGAAPDALCRRVAESSGRTNAAVDAFFSWSAYAAIAVGLGLAVLAATRGVRLGRGKSRHADHAPRRPRRRPRGLKAA